MARIRTIKPEFWTDDLIGLLSRDARLLFIATWNLADDEGLLRWSAPFLKGAVFPYDEDVTVKDVSEMMDALVKSGVVFAYVGGRSQQPLAYVVNFHKHQKINRPSPSKLPPPPLSDPKVREMYNGRDGGVCHLCDGATSEAQIGNYGQDFCPSPDHIRPVSAGGDDYPSNIKTAHLTCNKGRANRSVESYRELVMSGATVAQKRFPDKFTHIAATASSQAHGSFSEPSRQEREVDRDRDQETEWNGNGVVLTHLSADADPNPVSADISEAIQIYNSEAERHGWPKAQRTTAARAKALRGRLRECGGLDGWREAMRKAGASAFLTGKTPQNFKAHLDFFLQQSSFTKLMEGKYDGQSGQHGGFDAAFQRLAERQAQAAE